MKHGRLHRQRYGSKIVPRPGSLGTTHADTELAYPREHAAAIGVGQWTEQKVSGKQSRTSANAAISAKNATTALRSERTAMLIAQ